MMKFTLFGQGRSTSAPRYHNADFNISIRVTDREGLTEADWRRVREEFRRTLDRSMDKVPVSDGREMKFTF